MTEQGNTVTDKKVGVGLSLSSLGASASVVALPTFALHSDVRDTHYSPRPRITIIVVGMSLHNGEPRCLSLRRGFLFDLRRLPVGHLSRSQ